MSLPIAAGATTGLFLLAVMVATSSQETQSSASTKMQTTVHQIAQPTQPMQPAKPPSTLAVVGASTSLTGRIKQDVNRLPEPMKTSVAEVKVEPGRAPSEAPVGFSIAGQADCESKTVIIWRDGEPYNFFLMAHESTHLWACQMWGDANPPSEYVSLWSREGGVTSYGSTAPSEDFADAVALHLEGRLKEISPTRDAYIGRLLAPGSQAGRS